MSKFSKNAKTAISGVLGYLFFFAIISLPLFTQSALGVDTTAISQSNCKIAIIDTRQFMEKSLASQSMNKQVEQKADEYKKNAIKIQEKLQKKFQEIEAQKSTLSKEALTKKNEALAQEAESYQKSVYAERISLDKAFNDAMVIYENKIHDIVAKYAEENGIMLVITKEAALYNVNSIEITDVILEQLNKEMTDIKVNFEPSPTHEKTSQPTKKEGDKAKQTK
ncbi:OmpH family outer membrane protein [Candidatus Lariskella endosymbiont of Hedychridium roseum]|uniref:OmpH family outer membrane protein n=1 Tax=Candidatus Lariskella endosymbiont of Hedychridium roseum TaxID=3077949 RepID=UPI0030D5D76A